MKLSIGIVSYNNIEALKILIQSLQQFFIPSTPLTLLVKIYDNSEEEANKIAIKTLLTEINSPYFSFEYITSSDNVGFGTAINRIEASLPPVESGNDWLLVLNQDLELKTDTLSTLFKKLTKIDGQVAAVELRQLPFEHPKDYNPSTLQTDWISGAAFAVRRKAFQAVNGFDERLFLYAEDVDLSWRLRAENYQLIYLPEIAVNHYTVEIANQVKPAQVIEGTLNNLCLRACYGGFWVVIIGLLQLFVEILRKPNFTGRRKALLMIYPRFFKRFWSFYRSGKFYRQNKFKPTFLGWNFALHRRGAYYPSNPLSSVSANSLPLVSILIRTQNRPFYLREAILSALNQTYPNIEVVVVEDGENLSQSVVEALNDERIRYYAIGYQSGRSNAGNVALSKAKGEWFNFLDDDDQLYCDHVETLLGAILQQVGQEVVSGESLVKCAKAAYGATFEVMTDYQSNSYVETQHYERYREPYSIFTLLKYNFLPIQSVLFHRSLYDEHGGFNNKLDMLEDWNLWLKYGLNETFTFVDKTTSKYRVPAIAQVATKRKAGFQDALAEVILDQQTFSSLTISVQQAQTMLDSYQTSKTQMERQQKRIEAITSARWYVRLFYRSVYFAEDVIKHCRK